MLKRILISIVVCLAIVVIIFIWYINNQSIKVTIVKNAYNDLVSENQKTSFDIDLYVNQKNSYITDLGKISSCYLHSYNNSDKYQMNVNSIYLVNQTSISKDNYYVYKVNVSFKVNINDSLVMEEAYLTINYNNAKSLDLMIGSVSFYYKDSVSDNLLTLSCMKAITRKIDNIITIEGIIIRLNAKKDIMITNIELLDCNVTSNDVKLCNYENTNSSNDLDYLFASSYNYLDINKNDYSYLISGTCELAIRVGYKNHMEVNALAIRIDYLENGMLKSEYYDKFIYFVNNAKTVKVSDLTIYEFEYN